MITRPEVILFDMGGVLLESADMWTEPGYAKSFPDGLPDGASKSWFMEMSSEILRRYEALPAPRPAMDPRPTIAEWLRKCDEPASADRIEYWYSILGCWECRPLYSFVRETLVKLRSDGYRIGLVSNTLIVTDKHRKLFGEGGILELFEFMVFSAEFGTNKPDPKIFRYALDAMKIDAARAWYVGDKPHRDVCGAHGVGMTAVLVDGPYLHRVNDSPAHAPDLRIRDISELPLVLSQLR